MYHSGILAELEMVKRYKSDDKSYHRIFRILALNNIYLQHYWRSLPWVPKKNLVDIVTKAQVDAEKRIQENPEDPKARRRRLYKISSEEKPAFPVQQINFHGLVMENKEIVKMLGLLSSCTVELRQDLADFMERWKPYKFLWKNEKSVRELLQTSLTDFETMLRKHGELEDKLATEPELVILGSSIAISTEKLKYGLYTEIKGEIFHSRFDIEDSQSII